MSIAQLIDDNVSMTVLPSMTASDLSACDRPVLASAADVREFVQYLRLKPDGVVAAEELDRSKKRLFDERKLAAYESLGIITHCEGTLRLSARGRRFARNFEFDAQAFRSMLSQSMSCWSAVKWMSEQSNETITSPEVIGYWLKAHVETFGSFDDEFMKGTVVSFFSFCQGAGLGTMTLGKRGHITRFCLDRVELKRFVEGDALLIPDELGKQSFATNAPQSGPNEAKFKVLIHSQDVEIAKVLQETFDLVQLDNEKIELRWDNVISQKRLCDDNECALLVVIGDECFNGTAHRSVDEKVLLGLGGAHVLFAGRVIVLSEKKDLLLQKLTNLKCFEFDRSQLVWNTGLEIVRELIQMKDCNEVSTTSR